MHHDRRRPEQNGQDAQHAILDALMRAGADVVTQFPLCLSVYGTQLYVDFFIRNAAAYPDGFVIESKWQESNGTADEKFPYLVANIREQFPCPAIVIAAGRGARLGGHGGREEGARAGAITWMKRHINDKLLAVLTFEELLVWLRRCTFVRTRLW